MKDEEADALLRLRDAVAATQLLKPGDPAQESLGRLCEAACGLFSAENPGKLSEAVRDLEEAVSDALSRKCAEDVMES